MTIRTQPGGGSGQEAGSLPPGVAGPTTSQPAAPTGSDPSVWSWLNPAAWEAQLLIGLNLPITKTNVSALDAWALSEGTIGSNNPLAISGLYPGTTSCLAQCGTSSPVMAFSSLGAGVAATVNFLKGSYYGGIRRAFADANWQVEQTNLQNVSTKGGVGGNALLLNDIWNAINQSPWCKGCQGGKYPVRLDNLLNGQAFSAAELKTVGQTVAAGLGATGTTINQTTPSEQGNAVPGANVSNPLDYLASLGAFFSKLLDPNFWKEIGIVLLGGALLVGGAVIFLSDTKAGRAAETTGTAALL